MAAVAEQQQPAAELGWRAGLAPLALFVGLAFAIAGGLVVSVVSAIAGASVKNPPPVVSLVATLILDLALVASAVYFAAQVARPRAWQFGLRPTPLVQAAVAAIAGYGVFFAFSDGWLAALGVHDKEKLVDQLGANGSAIALVAVCLLTCVVAPICEELFFRGFFFVALRNRFGVWPAAVVTGLVFGGIHAGSAPASYLVPLAFFGVVLCIVYTRTGSLYPCIGLHALNNSIALGLTEHWRWQIPVLMVSALTLVALTLVGVARLPAAQ